MRAAAAPAVRRAHVAQHAHEVPTPPLGHATNTTRHMHTPMRARARRSARQKNHCRAHHGKCTPTHAHARLASPRREGPREQRRLVAQQRAGRRRDRDLLRQPRWHAQAERDGDARGVFQRRDERRGDAHARGREVEPAAVGERDARGAPRALQAHEPATCTRSRDAHRSRDERRRPTHAHARTYTEEDGVWFRRTSSRCAYLRWATRI